MAALLSEEEIAHALPLIPAWTRDGESLRRTYRFPNYLAGIAFVNEVASLAEHADHHPAMLIEWRAVTLTLTTHSARGLTALDFALARSVDKTAERIE